MGGPWRPWDDDDPVEDGERDDLAAPDDDAPPLFSVTNPPGTVSVTAYLNGCVQRVDLAPNVTDMTERELADEILVIAELARLKARSVMHTFLVEGMHRMGYDTAGLSAGLTADLDMPTREQAAEVTAQVFATRYASDQG